jgi:hypothetical protein
MNRSAFHRMSDDKRARIEEIAARDPDLKSCRSPPAWA